jgi:hypothetical protein
MKQETDRRLLPKKRIITRFSNNSTMLKSARVIDHEVPLKVL